MGDKSPLAGDKSNSPPLAASMILVFYDTPLLAAE
jgi:hypothetical protein